MTSDWLIVGAGFTGATLGERIASVLNQSVTIIDRRSHIGGNAFDSVNEHGVLVHLYGPHIFHTNSPKIWSYLSRFTQWRPYYHRVLASVDGQYVPVPFNYNSMLKLFPEYLANRFMDSLVAEFGWGSRVPILKLRASENKDLAFLANYVYDKIFLHYTTKQWDLTPEQLDPGVTARVPICVSRDDRYFQDRYQAMPADGYTRLFQKLLDHPKINVQLDTEWADYVASHDHRKVIFTGPVDEYFGFRHGRLPYRSIRFDFQHKDVREFQSVGTVNYPNDYDFTRVTEQKYLSGQSDLPGTTLIYEYPEPWRPGANEPYYPVPCQESRELYAKYEAEARTLAGQVYFAGRLADYRYYNMDQAVGRGLSLFEKELAQ